MYHELFLIVVLVLTVIPNGGIAQYYCSVVLQIEVIPVPTV